MNKKNFLNRIFDFTGKATHDEFRTYFWNPIYLNGLIYGVLEMIFAGSVYENIINTITPIATFPLIIVSIAALFRRNRALGKELLNLSTIFDSRNSSDDIKDASTNKDDQP